MTGFLSICTKHEAIGFLDRFALSATLLCLVRSVYLEKDDFFHEIFQAGACPNLKDSSLYEMYSIHMYKARNNLNLHQFSSICDSQKPSTVHFIFGKR